MEVVEERRIVEVELFIIFHSSDEEFIVVELTVHVLQKVCEFGEGAESSKIRVYDVSIKKKGVYVFPSCIHLVSWEKENASSEALEAVRTACNMYMTKFTGKDTFHRSSLSAPDPAPRPIVHPRVASSSSLRPPLMKLVLDERDTPSSTHHPNAKRHVFGEKHAGDVQRKSVSSAKTISFSAVLCQFFGKVDAQNYRLGSTGKNENALCRDRFFGSLFLSLQITASHRRSRRPDDTSRWCHGSLRVTPDKHLPSFLLQHQQKLGGSDGMRRR
ncbi:hypothetical protein TB2_002666 [Malus domestica]